MLNGRCTDGKDGVCFRKQYKKQCKVGMIPFEEMGKRDFILYQTKLSADCMLTCEPWARDMSVLDRAHELIIR